MTGESRYILWFSECDSTSAPQVGGKNASLGEMTKAGIRVPPGFAVTTRAYKEFVTQGDIQEELRRLLSRVDPQEPATAEEASRTIRHLMGSTPIPPAIEEAIQSAYLRLAEECQVEDLPVAVRSSATAEDLPGASFAGQQDTYLWIKGPGRVLIHCALCWSSLFTPRAITYRLKMGFPHDKVHISVGVQKMVNARVAGVMFTLNPLNGDRSKIVIDANWGLGESVVAGEVTPDNYMTDKVTLEPLRKTISLKTGEYRVNPKRGSVTWMDLTPERQAIPCLSEEELRELAQLGKIIERHYGRPQDIEWAIDGDLPFPENVFIVQSRPETVWSQKPVQPVIQSKEKTLDYVLDTVMKGVRLKS